MTNFTRFTTFPIFYHQSISFLEKSQKFSFHGEGYISKCFQFFNFFKSFHTKVAQKWPIMANFATKVAWMSSKWAILVKFQQKLKYLSRILTDLQNRAHFWASRNESKECYAMIKTDKYPNISAESWPICTKPSEQGSFFQTGQNESKECCAMIKTDGNLNISAESRLICTGNFFEFFNFFKSFHTEVAQSHPQWQILSKKWLGLAPNGQFCSFCRFFHLFL